MGTIKFLWPLLVVIFTMKTFTATDAVPCSPKDFGQGSIVCVCNATYCDDFESITQVPPNQFVHVVTTQDGKRFETTYKEIEPIESGFFSSFPFHFFHRHRADTRAADVTITINREETYQKILGFGGAFTDAACLNIKGLSQNLQDSILESYYGKSGLQYNIGRVNIGGCDFSTRIYSYDDVEGDETLENFKLADEDENYKIPLILKAMELNPNIKMFASSWSAPKWMKTNNDFIGNGTLKLEYYQTWANYYLRFLEEYSKRNVHFWALTGQNEPVVPSVIPNFPFNCMVWTAEMQRDWIKNNLGPTLASSPYKDTKIIILDDQRLFALDWARIVLADPDAEKYVSGIGLHWYLDEVVDPSILDNTNSEFPNKFLLGTEACAGFDDNKVILGSWDRGIDYAANILEDLTHWVSGWTDWNLVLDLQGGPNWVKNFVDAPIIVDLENDVAYKQPMYYALGHFSKFISENAVRIQASSDDLKNLEVLAVQNPDDTTTIVILSDETNPVHVQIDDPKRGTIMVEIPAKSINTIKY